MLELVQLLQCRSCCRVDTGVIVRFDFAKAALWATVLLASLVFSQVDHSRTPFQTPHPTGKSHPWTNASVGGNFRRTFRTIGPYKFPHEKVWANDWSIWISPEICMDQWCSKFSESFSLDRYWSIACSSMPYPQILGVTNVHILNVHFALRDISSMEATERRGGKKAWKGGVRWLRPKIWQGTKCTFEKCTFCPLLRIWLFSCQFSWKIRWKPFSQPRKRT